MILAIVLIFSGFLVSQCAALLRKHVAPAISDLVSRDVAVNDWLQHFRSPALTQVVKISASSVCVEFYAITLPVMIWCGLHHIGYLMIVYMAIENYLGLYMKVKSPDSVFVFLLIGLYVRQ
jgi:hypothetical protein